MLWSLRAICTREERSAVWVNGKQATDRTDVIAAISNALKNAANPLIVVDAIDLAGASEAVALARALNATLDHAASGNVRLLQEQGWLGTTPGEAVLRSDAVLLVGPLSEHIAHDEALRRLCDSASDRSFRYIGSDVPPGAIANLVGKGLAGTDIGNVSLTGLIGALRAHIKGHALSIDDKTRQAISTLGDWLMAARYGVAVFATGALDDLEGHALSGLLDDLSQKTRWNALPLSVPPGQNELQRMASSLTGLPVPSAFQDARARHDRWRYRAPDGIERGEFDAALWISSSINAVPDWLAKAKTVLAVSAHETAIAEAAAQAQIGIAGVDYAAIVEPAEIGAFAAISPPEATIRETAAGILAAIRAHVDEQGAAA